NSRSSTRTMRRAHDDGVSGNNRSGVQPEFSCDRIQFLIVVQLQIDDSAFTESRDRDSCFGVQSNEPVARSNMKNPFFVGTRVFAIGKTTPRKVSRGVVPAWTFTLAVHPQELTARRIQRNDIASRSCRRVKNTTNHQRSGLKVCFGPGAKALGLESPRD